MPQVSGGSTCAVINRGNTCELPVVFEGIHHGHLLVLSFTFSSLSLVCTTPCVFVCVCVCQRICYICLHLYLSVSISVHPPNHVSSFLYSFIYLSIILSIYVNLSLSAFLSFSFLMKFRLLPRPSSPHYRTRHISSTFRRRTATSKKHTFTHPIIYQRFS